MDDASLRAEPGTYALLLRADAERPLDVGALGSMTVQPGAYVYVGSAFGPGGVQARVQRHADDAGPPHWHVDYLRRGTTLTGAWITYDDQRRECTWATAMAALPGAAVPLTCFGASDCNCASHLFRFDDPPSFSRFRERIRARFPTHAPLLQVQSSN